MVEKIINWGICQTNKYVGLRYFIAGGFAGVTDLAVLYVLDSLLGVHYLIAAILAFITAFIVSFLGHKFWTFKSHEEKTHKQVVMYFGSTMIGLALNTLLMYIFVDHFHMQVILSQIIVGLLVALVSFFISKNHVFKYKEEQII